MGKVRIITDERTNALIVLAPKTQLEEVRRLVNKLDVPVTGGGRIHVYYLQHADSEELAQTLTAADRSSAGTLGASSSSVRSTVLVLPSSWERCRSLSPVARWAALLIVFWYVSTGAQSYTVSSKLNGEISSQLSQASSLRCKSMPKHRCSACK